MMPKANIAVLLAFCWAVAAFAAPLSSNDVARAMGNWRHRRRTLGTKLGEKVLDVRRIEWKGVSFHVVRFEGGGHLIAPTDTRIRPVVMFSGADDIDLDERNPALALIAADIGGELQLTGGESRAEIIRRDFANDRDVFAIDISSAYPATRGKSRALVREVVFDRSAESVTITDRLKVASPVAFESAVVSYGKTCPLVPAVDGGAWHREEKSIENPGRRTANRFAVAFDGPVAEACVAWSFKADGRRSGK